MLRRARSNRGTFLALAMILTIFALVTATAAGCGSDDPAEGTASTTASSATAGSLATTTSSAAPATSASSETTVATTPSSEPAGEVGATVSVSSTNGGYPKENIPDWSQIISVEAYRTASVGVASLWISLATYEVSADSIVEYSKLPRVEPGQGRIQLLLTRTLSGVNEPPMVTGTYDFNVPQGQVELTGEAAIVLAGGTQVTFTRGALESDVQITALSDTQVSGTFHIKDKWSEISGAFTAPIR